MFALLMSFLRVIFHTMWSGKSMQLLCILSLGILFCLSSDTYCISTGIGSSCILCRPVGMWCLRRTVWKLFPSLWQGRPAQSGFNFLSVAVPVILL